MIKKEREKPVRLQIYEAARRRLSPKHHLMAIIEVEYGKSSAGYQGEKGLDFFLSFLPNDNYQILHGLRIADPKNRYFQMDTLLIAPTHCLIIEAKNISGSLEFDEKAHQLIRRGRDGEERLGDPISQVERHRYQFSSWLRQHHFPDYPIECQVVISNNNATLVKTTPTILKKVTFHTSLPYRMKQIDEKHPTPILNEKEIRKLVRNLIKKHTPDNFALLDYYKIPITDIITGVICPTCSHYPMFRRKCNWFCQKCGCRSKSAHLDALKDYALLISNHINNRELRDFLHLGSTSVASKILTSLNLRTEGNTKGKRYFFQ